MNHISVAKVQTISCISSHFLAFLLFCTTALSFKNALNFQCLWLIGI